MVILLEVWLDPLAHVPHTEGYQDRNLNVLKLSHDSMIRDHQWGQHTSDLLPAFVLVR